MKRQTRKDLNELCGQITELINRTSNADLFDVGFELCAAVSLAVTDGMEGKNDIDTMLLPIHFIGDVKTALTEAIDREFLDELGAECVRSAKEDQASLDRDADHAITGN